MRLARPVPKIPPPTMNRPPIIITIGLEKPESASSGDSIPVSTRARAEQIATKSERNLPLTNKIADMAKMMSVIVIAVKIIR